MPEDLKTLFNVLVLIFVLSTMLGLGLDLTIRRISAPLRNRSLLARALLVNFVVAPALAYVIARLFDLERDLGIGLFILGVAAGSPMTIKVVQIARGDMAFAAGLMVTLQILTIALAPLMLTLLVDDIAVDVPGMTTAMVATMLLPLALGLLVNARYPELGDLIQPHVKQAASITLVLQAMLGLVSSQRNTSAALLITIQNFAEPAIVVMVITGAALMMAIGAIAAGELGKRSQTGERPIKATTP
ncbi:MAG: bile acid:sodium symporter [Actinomycetota bacterium]